MATSLLGNTGTYEGYAYRLGASTGALAAGTVGDIYQFRWNPNVGSTTTKARILQVRINVVDASAFTAGQSALSMYVARAFSASGTGGTAVTPTTNSNKMRTSQPTSKVADIRIATNTQLGNGTRTLDTQPIGIINIPDAGAGTDALSDSDLFFAALGSYAIPLVLAPNEGFVIQTTALAALGTAVIGVNVLWAEVDGGLNG